MPDERWLRTGADGWVRCWWAGESGDYVAYHDDEWGRPVGDDHRLFEKLSLEGFQSGLSWLTILRKRENFRAAFDGFDYRLVARYGDADVERLLGDAGIVRHRGKIEATVNNASRAIEVAAEHGSLASYLWSFEPEEPEGERDGEYPIPSVTPTSARLAKDLKKRGWRFVGPTTVYAFMQAMGLVNDHVEGCHVRSAIDTDRAGFARP